MGKGNTTSVYRVVQVQGVPLSYMQVRDMQPDDDGYIYPWDVLGDTLNGDAVVHSISHQGTTVRVSCVAPGEYQIIHGRKHVLGWSSNHQEGYYEEW